MAEPATPGKKETAPEDLFRQEVLAARQLNWLGDVSIADPLGVRLLRGCLFAGLALAVAYAVWGDYTRKMKVPGFVVASQGAVKVTAPQPGQVASVRVKEGQRVAAGDTLVILSSERTTAQGTTIADIVRQIELKARAAAREKLQLIDV